ncbi:MAG: GNAT superfamily N-acetyltransferase [Verrucomicrobiales bacterium]|jgi:GNAT superfamily N-acetyltransferase
MGPLQEQTGLLFLRGQTARTLVWLLSARKALSKIEGVLVDKGHRSQGVGRLLITEAICRAREKSCHLVQFTTDKARSEAKKFYKSLGFEASHEGLKLSL